MFIDFPETLKAGRDYTIDFHYSGNAAETGRFGGMAFEKDPAGQPWINTACEGEGSSGLVAEQGSVARRSREHGNQRRHPQRSGRRVERQVRRQDRSRRRLHALGLARAVPDQLLQRVAEHRQLRALRAIALGDLPLDFYVLPGSLEKAKRQFAQAKGDDRGVQKYFGEYPFKKDGYKLIEVPYSGMEHQSAVTYGNRFANGYLERDWTGVGISMKFDFIIIHESAPRVVRQRRVGGRRVRHVDSRGLGDVSRESSTSSTCSATTTR